MLPQTLKKNEKLSKVSDFKGVYTGGKFYKNSLLTIIIVPNGSKINRVGFSIRKKLVRLNCEKNRIKRLLRETYRQNKHRIDKGFDIIFIAKIAYKKLSFQCIEKEMLGLFKKAGILKVVYPPIRQKSLAETSTDDGK